jgi:putative addiction module component (TIGR02574 family)
MATKEFNQLATTVLALPPRQRAQLAQELWDSIDQQAKTSALDDEEMAEIRRRDREISQGKVRGRSHREVMKAARKSIGCSR